MSSQDYSRSIISSLFSPPPGQPTQESFIAYVATYEDQPGSSTRKARFLILSALRDGRLRMHKAKQNANGSFSIGKTWGLEDLQRVEVGKRLVQGRMQPLEFTLVINNKTYRYDTDLPSSQQAQFLVTMVRCWRRFMAGRNAPDLALIGFSVDSPNPSSGGPPPPQQQQPSGSSMSGPSRPSASGPPSRPSQSGPPPPHGPPRPSYSSQSAQPGPPPPSSQHRPSSAASNASSARPSLSQSQQSDYSLPPNSRPSAGPSGGGGAPPPGSQRPSNASAYSMANAAPGRPESPLRRPSAAQGPLDRGPAPGHGGGERAPSRTSISSVREANGSSGPSASGGRKASIAPDPRSGGGAPPTSSSSSSRQGSASTGAGVPPSRRPTADRERDAAPIGIGIDFSGGAGLPQQAPGASTRPPGRMLADEPGPPPMGAAGSSGRFKGAGSKPGAPPKGGRSSPASSKSPGGTAGEADTPSPFAPSAASLSATTVPIPGILARKLPKTAEEDHTLIVDEETVLSNVEEMLEGFEWRGGLGGALNGGGTYGGGAGGGGGGMGGGAGGKKEGRSKADEIEKRLVGELKALEAASIHAIMESDDRVTGVIKQLDDALAELDKMELVVGVYKTQLNLMTDDIAHIESQNRGLQVQTSNQRALLAELDKLMSTIHIPASDLTALIQESLENPQGIERLERAAVSVYKALLSTRDTAVGDMAAASERLGEYHAKANQFCKRVFDFLSIMFKFQVDQILNPKDAATRSKTQLPSHQVMEDFLGRYCGLMLFVKEIDAARYGQICGAYFTAMSDLHRQEIQELMSALRGQVRKASDDDLEASFTTKESPTMRQQSMRRVGTIARSPLEGGKKDKDKDGKLSASEAFGRALQQVTPHLTREQGFIADFLHISPLDSSITFADYMMLETFFRRGASSYLAQQAQAGKLRDIRAAMESVFGWLEAEVKDWIEGVLGRDSMQIVGILAALDRFILHGEEDRNEFLMRTLQKQYQRSLAALERSCKEQVKSIEQTKLTLKKRKGVVPFVRIFPLFVARVESQLDNCDNLNIRGVINVQYERIVATMFDSLQQMAKMDGEGQGQGGEGKDQLNYHVILVENMHHIIATFSNKQKVPALAPFVAQAREKYDQNLAAYIRLILRRPLARVLDFFAGLEQLLRTTPPTEVSLHSAYTRSALRRTTSDVRSKDLRKAIDVLYKRVDKHFGGDVASPAAEQNEVLKTVWKATEDEMQRLVGNWKGLVAKCYPDEKSGGVEVDRNELHQFFKHAQVS
ncbi:hypothetical protein JCM6882_005804 [Rhodosporidiobolus microsporus]